MTPALHLGGKGKVALITGAARGIGRATAQVFGEAGYRLLLADVDRDLGEAAAGELTAQGHEAQFVATDVADSAQGAAAVQMALERWDRLDFVFNNAGIVGHGSPIDSLDEVDLDRVLDVDLKGPFQICKHAVRAQKERGGGSILNVASITAETGSAYFTAYSAAKAGVIALTRSIARNVGRFNIRVNCLNPGSTAGTCLMEEDRRHLSPQARLEQRMALMKKIPLGRIGEPRDVAHLALFLASPLASHIHGAVITIDGGESLGFQ
jgi:NAD(P)-dependent dehydrogenase (short-subunit alcohol dehydrogenase family)